MTEQAGQGQLVELPKEIKDAGLADEGTWWATFWAPPSARSYEYYEKLLNVLRPLRLKRERELDSIYWWLADALNNAEMDVGEKYSQLLDAAGLVKESLIKVRRTGEVFQPGERFHPDTGVSFWTHWEVRRLDKAERHSFLFKYANDPNYSRDDLRSDVRLRLDQREGEENPTLLSEGSQTGNEGMEGSGESENGSTPSKELPTCPLCDGAGHVTPDRRDAYLMEEGVMGR